MTDYSELVKALRRCDMKQGCFNANCRYSVGKYFCDMNKVHNDAAAAIEALQAEVDALKHDIELYVGINAELATEIEALQAEVERLQADVDAAYAH